MQGSKEVFMERVNLDSMLRGDLRKSYAHWSAQHPLPNIACVFPVTCSMCSGVCTSEMRLLLDDDQQAAMPELVKLAMSRLACLTDSETMQLCLHRMSVQGCYSRGLEATTELSTMPKLIELVKCNQITLNYCCN